MNEKEKIDKLKEALMFYANKENYLDIIVLAPGYTNTIEQDQGDIAKKALELTK